MLERGVGNTMFSRVGGKDLGSGKGQSFIVGVMGQCATAIMLRKYEACM